MKSVTSREAGLEAGLSHWMQLVSRNYVKIASTLALGFMTFPLLGRNDFSSKKKNIRSDGGYLNTLLSKSKWSGGHWLLAFKGLVMSDCHLCDSLSHIFVLS